MGWIFLPLLLMMILMVHHIHDTFTPGSFLSVSSSSLSEETYTPWSTLYDIVVAAAATIANPVLLLDDLIDAMNGGWQYTSISSL